MRLSKPWLALSRFVSLALSLSIAACSSTQRPDEPIEPLARYTYHADLTQVPAGAAEVRVGVVVPDQGGALRPLSVFGLVGNAPFELVLSDDSGAVEQAHVRVSWERRAGPDRSGAREIVVATRGKPLELGVRLAARAGAELDARALTAELSEKTWAEIDGQPAPPPVTRCERSD